jgi:hypothetical protein
VKEETIYESAVENGYRTGIRAHQLFIVDHQQTEPVVLDDKQFTMLIKHLLPSGLKPAEQGLWRSYFIIGWTCVYLGIAADDEEAVADSDI